MTPSSIHDRIFDAFRAIHPGADITVTGAGTERISVSVILPAPVGTLRDYNTYVCELDSDDDGYFTFYFDGLGTRIQVPYPA